MRCIEIKGASQNNLKGIDVSIPLGSFTVVCGLSGSGKSSLAFETLYAEGQRRYLQNLSNYIKQYIIQQKQPEVESITNLPPALALEQKNSVRSSRSTVASLSGLSDHLRLVFEKLSVAYCPTHKTPLESFSASSASDYALKHFEGERAYLLVPVFYKQIIDELDFLKGLYQSGFSRILVPEKKDILKGKIQSVEDLKKLPKKDFFILIDRLSLDQKEKSRLVDSLGQAFKIDQLLKKEQQAVCSAVWLVTLEGQKRIFSKKQQCPECSFDLGLPITSPLFNFNSPLGACVGCQGYGYSLKIDEKKVIPNSKLSLKEGAVKPLSMPSTTKLRSALKQFCLTNKISYEKPWCDLTPRQRKSIWEGDKSFKGINGYFKYLEGRRHKMHVRIMLSRYRSPFLCETCKGQRLRQEVNSIFLHKKKYTDFMSMTLEDMESFFKKIKWKKEEIDKCKESLEALESSLYYLNSIGLNYLSLDRTINTLSGGELQRLNLSNQLGLRLSQVLYVLDEPTVGLHPRDTHKMIELIKELKDLGNTIVIVEHDQDVIEHSDYIIEMGPQSGQKGGELLWAGKRSDFLKSENSNTVAYLKRNSLLLKTPRPTNKQQYKYSLSLKQASGHNLKEVDLFIPLNRFVVVTGVSGSGKSSLISNTLYPALEKEIKGNALETLPYKNLSGYQHLKDVVLMDQSEIGKTSRSFIASYLKSYDVIRKLFSVAPLSKRQGFKPSSFSLNVEGGRCPSCKGLAYQEIDMVFMDSIRVLCEECEGKKFKKEVLEVTYNELNILDVLNLTVEEALHFFKLEASLLRPFSALKEVGLSYLTLGQGLSSLSGGERQRLKLARELLNSHQEKTLYILDEPTKGLHFQEIDLLLKVLNRLIETGASVVLIEHNLEVIKEADYIIDIGPEAGEKGGQIVAEGDPETLIKSSESHTGKYLKEHLTRLSRPSVPQKNSKKSRSKKSL